MIKKNLIITATILFYLLPVNAQVKRQESGLKREVTLYNPYKPTLPDSKKRSFLPLMNDTVKVKPEFSYEVRTKPFVPEYTVSPIKPAALLPDPLTKLYKSYVNIGFGNYTTPLAEISITNERSKKGTIGFYGRHLSSNGKIELEKDNKVFAGYMDNDASLFGRKFFKKSLFEGSVDLTQKVRYAYGYDTSIDNYTPVKSDIKTPYTNLGGKASLSSVTMDSAKFAYDFTAYYNYFYNAANLYQHNFGIDGIMAKSYKGFYVGSGISYVFYKSADSLSLSSDKIFSISPFVKKATEQWSFKLGFQALLDRSNSPHIYPDMDFSFNIVPAYIRFFVGLSGKLERNEPLKIINENPFLVSDQFPDFVPTGLLFRLPDTDHTLIVSAGVKGKTGLNGTYLVSASYSMIKSMLFYSNLVFPFYIQPQAVGNYFMPISQMGEIFNIHGETTGEINDKLSYYGAANFYNYNFSSFAWNKPNWDGKFGLKYNLRDKILAGLELSALGKRMQVVNGDYTSGLAGFSSQTLEAPSHFNLNISAEYRYSKILSFWTKVNNISNNRYYEWAYYPSQRFLFMLGFTYSL
jgi:hypothetical protein